MTGMNLSEELEHGNDSPCRIVQSLFESGFEASARALFHFQYGIELPENAAPLAKPAAPRIQVDDVPDCLHATQHGESQWKVLSKRAATSPEQYRETFGDSA